MEDSDNSIRQFVHELERRFEEVQQWAIANWPDPEHPLSSSNFVEARKEILALGQMSSEINRHAPEPADGGPQYVSTTPAPWP
ncbi:MAG TPA: hypothetical protein VGP06_13775 [Janthinobacterium sp.]|jgi:hypothetical protein|nr:hypothetical protein [Janthinobacterium sp.]